MKRDARTILKTVRPLLIRAVAILALYALANVAGMRSDMALLSGTIPLADINMSVLLCVLYLGLYVGATIVAPILVLAAVLEALILAASTTAVAE